MDGQTSPIGKILFKLPKDFVLDKRKSSKRINQIKVIADKIGTIDPNLGLNRHAKYYYRKNKSWLD